MYSTLHWSNSYYEKKRETKVMKTWPHFKSVQWFFFSGMDSLYSRHKVTNYVHMIGVGHMLGHMHQYGNWNKYSQQSWEALNILIKLFFRANKGGKSSGRESTELKSKIVPIGCSSRDDFCGFVTLCLIMFLMRTTSYLQMKAALKNRHDSNKQKWGGWGY